MSPPPERVVLAQGLLYHALGTPGGIVLSCSDVRAGRALLYAARAAAMDPELAALSFRLNPLKPTEEIWVLRTGPTASPPIGDAP